MERWEADAMRDELRDALLSQYGSLEAAAPKVGIPYKTLYRALTARGKDRVQTVSFDFVVMIADHLGITLGQLRQNAQQRRPR